MRIKCVCFGRSRGCNMRKEPNMTSDKISVIRPDNILTITSMSRFGQFIQVKDNDGRIGYVVAGISDDNGGVQWLLEDEDWMKLTKDQLQQVCSLLGIQWKSRYTKGFMVGMINKSNKKIEY